MKYVYSCDDNTREYAYFILLLSWNRKYNLFAIVG